MPFFKTSTHKKSSTLKFLGQNLAEPQHWWGIISVIISQIFFVQSMPFSFIGSGITKNFLARVCDFLLEKKITQHCQDFWKCFYLENYKALAQWLEYSSPKQAIFNIDVSHSICKHDPFYLFHNLLTLELLLLKIVYSMDNVPQSKYFPQYVEKHNLRVNFLSMLVVPVHVRVIWIFGFQFLH